MISAKELNEIRQKEIDKLIDIESKMVDEACEIMSIRIMNILKKDPYVKSAKFTFNEERLIKFSNEKIIKRIIERFEENGYLCESFSERSVNGNKNLTIIWERDNGKNS